MSYYQIIVSGCPEQKYQARGVTPDNRVLAVNRLRQPTAEAALAAFRQEWPDWNGVERVTVLNVPLMKELAAQAKDN